MSMTEPSAFNLLQSMRLRLAQDRRQLRGAAGTSATPSQQVVDKPAAMEATATAAFLHESTAPSSGKAVAQHEPAGSAAAKVKSVPQTRSMPRRPPSRPAHGLPPNVPDALPVEAPCASVPAGKEIQADAAAAPVLAGTAQESAAAEQQPEAVQDAGTAAAATDSVRSAVAQETGMQHASEAAKQPATAPKIAGKKKKGRPRKKEKPKAAPVQQTHSPPAKTEAAAQQPRTPPAEQTRPKKKQKEAAAPVQPPRSPGADAAAVAAAAPDQAAAASAPAAPAVAAAKGLGAPCLSAQQRERLQRWSYEATNTGPQVRQARKRSGGGGSMAVAAAEQVAGKQAGDSNGSACSGGGCGNAQGAAAAAAATGAGAGQGLSMEQVRVSWSAGIARASERALAPCSAGMPAERRADRVDWAAVKRALPDGSVASPSAQKQPARKKRCRRSGNAAEVQPAVGGSSSMQVALLQGPPIAGMCAGGRGNRDREGDDEACMDALQPLLRQLDPLEGLAPDLALTEAAAEPGPPASVGTSVAEKFKRRLSAVMGSAPGQGSLTAAGEVPAATVGAVLRAPGHAASQPAEGTGFEEVACARGLALQQARAQHGGWRQLQPLPPPHGLDGPAMITDIASKGSKADDRQRGRAARPPVTLHAAVKAAEAWQGRFAVRLTQAAHLGVFTLDMRAEGEVLLEFVGEVLCRSAAQARAHAASAAAAAPAQLRMLPLDDDNVVDASGAGGTASFIRHSGRPNCRACVLEGREGRRIFVLAARQLAPDEELTLDFKQS